MDISNSLVAVGCKFAFHIDISGGKHWDLTHLQPTQLFLTQKNLLRTCRHATGLLNILSKNSTHIITSLLMLDSPIHVFIPLLTSFFPGAPFGPILLKRLLINCNSCTWCLTAILKGASYELEHVHKKDQKEKKTLL
jgi:hypothetical protein